MVELNPHSPIRLHGVVLNRISRYRDEFICTFIGSGKLLLVLASTVSLGSESRGTYDYTLLSHDYDLNL
jgi:hypothetical protein